MTFNTEHLQAVYDSFQYDPKLKKRKMYRIKVNGRFIKTKSGKTVWAGVGAAKNALHEHLGALYPGYLSHNATPEKKILHQVYQHRKEIYKYIIEMGIVEFVEVRVMELNQREVMFAVNSIDRNIRRMKDLLNKKDPLCFTESEVRQMVGEVDELTAIRAKMLSAEKKYTVCLAP